MFPSALFLHFNIDIKGELSSFISFHNLIHTSDVQFVKTNGELPKMGNHEPLDGSNGRGSCVWFNQASMFQYSELGGMTVKEAAAANLPTSCDAKALLEQGYFPQCT